MAHGKLFLIPTPVGGDLGESLPPAVLEVIRGLGEFIVEDERTARRFLSKVGLDRPIREIQLRRLSEHTRESEYSGLLRSIVNGKNVGLLSEAGCPCVADPGSPLVKLAQSLGVEVIPLVGPSSIVLALMASGLGGQNFAFVGYLPKERSARIRRIHELEHLVRRQEQTQLFIETPYRNNHVLEDLLDQLDPNTHLCLAVEVGSPNASIQTKQVVEWIKMAPDLSGRPTVFLIGK